MTVHIPGIDADIGKLAPDFRLPATDGKTYSLSNIAGEKGTVVVFICNHCPYVKGVAGRLIADAKALAKEGIRFVAISSNDVAAFPEDSFPMMKEFAAEHSLPFPYLFDETQEVARAYGAQCTPDFFGLNVDRVIAYRGRLDERKKDPPPPGAKRELLDAMRMVAKTGEGPAEQIAAVGCSIKWKEA